MSVFAQDGYAVRFEWGLEGLKALAPVSDVVIIVDVLSFTTCVCAGVERKAIVYPFKSKDGRAAEFAAEHKAILAGSRSEHADYSLSPRSMLKLGPGDRIVLPSPNGSQLSTEYEDKLVLAGCLRNANPTAEKAMGLGKVVSVIAAGEKWKGTDLLRPSFEDLAGAGAIIHALDRPKSPEALSAEAAFLAAKNSLVSLMNGCVSGQQLIEMGFPDDVSYSAELNVSQAVPILRDGAYTSST